MHVTQVMHRNVQTICPDATVRDAAVLMKTHNVGLLPVLEEGEATGVLTDRDITVRLVAEDRSPTETRVRDIMTEPIDTVSDYQDVEDVTEMMRRKKLHRVLVLDRDNYVVGVVSLSDLAHHDAKQLSGQMLDEVSRRDEPTP